MVAIYLNQVLCFSQWSLLKFSQWPLTKLCKQVSKYSNTEIFTKNTKAGVILGIEALPLPLALWYLQETS